LSNSGGATGIIATYAPSDGNSLAQEASLCGYQGFDWQQYMTTLPDPSPYSACDNAGCTATHPLTSSSTPFLDPPPNGYSYALKCGNTPSQAYRQANPYYYDPNGAPGDCFSLQYRETANTLSFFDTPSDPCLPGPHSILPGVLQILASCENKLAPDGSYLGFLTELVGITSNGTPSAPLASFQWVDTFNGTSGGIATAASDLPADPDSGYGGITIVAIDGVSVPEPSSILLFAQALLVLITLCTCRRAYLKTPRAGRRFPVGARGESPAYSEDGMQIV
jgi:hypothetical protein